MTTPTRKAETEAARPGQGTFPGGADSFLTTHGLTKRFGRLLAVGGLGSETFRDPTFWGPTLE